MGTLHQRAREVLGKHRRFDDDEDEDEKRRVQAATRFRGQTSVQCP